MADLNDKQRAAVEAPASGVIKVSSLAGTGKSTALLKRVEYLYEQDPGKLLLLAFNSSIADELRSRLSDLENKWAVSRTNVFTSYALGYYFVRKNWKTLGLPVFPNVPPDWKVVKDGIEVARANGYKLTESACKALLAAEAWRRSSMESDYAKYINRSLILKELTNTKTNPKAIPMRDLVSISNWMYNSRRSKGMVVYMDMISLALELDQDVFDREDYKHVLVDEAQDLSPMQHELVKRISDKSASITFIGDTRQCFPPGTLITTPSGFTPIELLSAGDLVMSCAGHSRVVPNKVDEVLTKSYVGKMVTITTSSGRSITCTPDHPVFSRVDHNVADELDVRVNQWFHLTDDSSTWKVLPAGSLYEGASVLICDGKLLVQDFIASMQWTDYEGIVYDLNIDRVHNYIAGGLVVHNCIYAWNGADPEVFDTLEDKYNAKEYVLDINYRSTQPILNLANSLLSLPIMNTELRLKPNVDKSGTPVYLCTQQEDIAFWVQNLLDNGVDHSDISILFRARAHTLELETMLAKASIPYTCTSGSFFEHAVPNDLLAYYRLLMGTPNQDDWKTVVRHRSKFLSSELLDAAFDENNAEPWNANPKDKFKTETQKGVFRGIKRDLNTLKKRIDSDSPLAVLTELQGDYLNFKWAEDFADDPDLESEYQMMIQATKDWLGNFASGTALMAEYLKRPVASSKGILVSSTHKAKGLEWDHVAIWNAGNGTFPLKEEPEEFRLLYVAVTRAKKELAIFSSKYDSSGGILGALTEDPVGELRTLLNGKN